METMSATELDIESIKQQLSQLSKEELVDRLALYEWAIPKLGPWVRWGINNMFQLVMARWRMGREAVGYLVGMDLQPESLILLTDEEQRDYMRKKVVHEQHLVYAKVKELSYFDVILGRSGEEELRV